MLIVSSLFIVQMSTAQSFQVDTVVPRPYAVDARPFDPIRITFSDAVNASALNADQIVVYGSQTGRCVGTISYEEPTQTVVYDPPCAFREGELVSVTVTGVQSASGATAPAYQWQFTPRVEYGSGTFDGPDEFDLGLGKDPVYIFAGDLDGDLFADLAVANSGAGTVSILINQRNRARRFAQEVEVEVGNGPYNVTGGDLNADGLLDLVVSNLLENTVSVLMNQGNAVFVVNTLETGERPLRVEVLDVDNDGYQDLAVAAFGIDQVWLHRNNGDATFSPAITYDVGASPAGMVARDWDNDGYIDLYVASLGDQQLNFLRNDGTGAFEPIVTTQLGFSPAVLVANDLLGITGNRFGDSLVDLVVSAQNERDIWVYQNTGVPGALQPAFTIPVDSTSSQALGLVIADIDSSDVEAEMQGLGKDYDLDVISSHFTSGEIRPAINSANAAFLPAVPATYPTSLLPQARNPTGIEAADLDGDGDIDLVVSNTTSGRISVFYNIGGREAPLAVLPDQLTFGDICLDADSSRAVFLQNTTNYPISVEISVRPDEGVYFPDTTMITLDPGQSDFVSVNFVPLAARDYEAELVLRSEIESLACGENVEPVIIEQTVPLFGRGVATQFTVTPDTLDFGVVLVGDSGIQSAVLDNQGNIAGQISEYLLSDAVNFSIDSPIAPALVGAMSQQQVAVQFQPTVEGDFLETLDIVTEDMCGVDTLRVVLRASSIEPPPIADLVAVDLFRTDGSTATILRGEQPDYSGVFRNDGDLDVTTPFDVEIRSNGIAVATMTYDELLVGEEVTFTAPVVFPDAGLYTLSFFVDAGLVIDELTEDNNEVVLEEFEVELPDAITVEPNPFTPNGDSFNDYVAFNVMEFGLFEPVLRIFSFEGRLIRTDNEIIDGYLRWDGRDTSGREQRPGVYLYTVEDERQVVASGHITLAR